VLEYGILKMFLLNIALYLVYRSKGKKAVETSLAEV
jgi:hypothetical protein